MPHRILIQAGHNAPMQPGHERQTGAPGERDLVRDIQLALVKLLEDDPSFKAIPVPGKIPSGERVDAALFLHADGASNPAAAGYSFGYPNYAVNKQLALLIADEFERLPGHPPRRRDNYTRDQSGYYGFRLVGTPGPEVLVEHGFMTNPRERAWLGANVNALARAEYRALRRFFGLEQDRVMTAHVGGSARPVRTARPIRTKTEAGLRRGAAQTTARLATLAPGTDVEITGSNGNWRRVRIGGWVHKSLLEERPKSARPTTPGAPVTDAAAITVGTTLMAPARTTPQRAIGYIRSRPHGEYTEGDVDRIVRLYFDCAGSAGLDPLLVLTQMVLETGSLSSFWSQRPRRNPAGIGVTGAAGEGLSFPDWDTAVRAHVGRLLAYVIPAGSGNAPQQQLIVEALSFRDLPAVYRGVVRKLGDLGHGVWAADPNYRDKLVRLANDIRSHRT